MQVNYVSNDNPINKSKISRLLPNPVHYSRKCSNKRNKWYFVTCHMFNYHSQLTSNPVYSTAHHLVMQSILKDIIKQSSV